jgi:carboxyl-terminal processing protease
VNTDQSFFVELRVQKRIDTIGMNQRLKLFGLCIASLGVSVLFGCTSSSKTEEPVKRTISSEEALADFDRMWEIVNETHFDETFNGVDWVAVRDELRPQASQAQTRSQLRRTMGEALGRLGQSHFGIIPQAVDKVEVVEEVVESDESESYAKTDAIVPDDSAMDGVGDADTGIDIRIIDGQAIVSSIRNQSPAQLAGVQTGWILSKIRARDVEVMLDQLRESIGEDEIGIHGVSVVGSRLQGPEGSSIDLTFIDGNDDEVQVSVARAPMPGEFVKFGNLPPMSTHLEWSKFTTTSDSGQQTEIGVIKFNVWMIPIAPKFERAMYELRDVDGLIIDLRGNPGGVGALSSSIGRFLMSEKGSLGIMTMRGAELSFNIEPVIVTTWGEVLDPFTGPIAVLMDSGSASTSEVFAGGLQSLGRIEVFGTRSAGMALPAGMDKLPSGDVLLHAIADFETSTGQRLEYGGVVPDFPVELTRKDLLMGVDSPKQAAQEWITETTAE